MNLKLFTYNKALDRARALGYASLEDCIIQRISGGTTVRDLSLKLDVSENYLSQWMEKLGVHSVNQKKTRFWQV